MTANNNLDFLNEIYRNALSGVKGSELLIEKTTDSRLKTDLYGFLSQYQLIANRAKAQIEQQGGSPKEPNPAAQAQMWMGVQLNTMIDKTPSHMASMLMQGSTMGIVSSVKAIHQNPVAPPEIKDLARDLVELEEKSMLAMKKYL